MTRSCTVCVHPHLDDINTALVAGEPVRAVGARFRTEAGALGRMAVQRVLVWADRYPHLPQRD